MATAEVTLDNMATNTKIIKIKGGENGSLTYVPVTLADAVQYSAYNGYVTSVQQAIGTLAQSQLSIADHLHDDHDDIQHISSANETSNKVKITLDKEGNSVSIGGHNPNAATSTYAYVGLSTTNNVTTIKVSYTDTNTAKAKFASKNGKTVYTYVSPTSNSDTTNGSTLQFTEGSNVTLTRDSDSKLTISASYTDTKFTAINKSSSDTSVANTTYSVSVIANQNYTGTGTSITVNSYAIPTQNAVDKALKDAKDYADTKVASAIHIKGNVGPNSAQTSLPTSNVEVGDAWIVTGVTQPNTTILSGESLENGDLIIATSKNPIAWTVIQNNLDVATDSKLGSIKIGYSTDTTNKKYAVQLDTNNKAYVNVPWDSGSNTAFTKFASKNGTTVYAYVNTDSTPTGGTNHVLGFKEGNNITLTRDADNQMTIASSYTDRAQVNVASKNNKTVYTYISPDGTEGTGHVLQLVEGDNVTLTADTTNEKITIAASYTNTDRAKAYWSSVTTSGNDTSSVLHVGPAASATADGTNGHGVTLKTTKPIVIDVSGDVATLTHSNDAGYKHIPSGGSANQVLKYSSSGTAAWSTPSVTLGDLTEGLRYTTYNSPVEFTLPIGDPIDTISLATTTKPTISHSLS